MNDVFILSSYFLFTSVSWTSSTEWSGFASISDPLDKNDGKSSIIIFNSGSNITLNCEGKKRGRDVAWIQVNKKVKPSSRIRHESDGRLAIDSVFKSDEGIYVCQDIESNQSVHTVRLKVRTVPDAVSNFTVSPRSVFALVTWNDPIPETDPDLRLPISKYVLAYRPEHDDNDGDDKVKWRRLDNVSGNAITVYKLRPNSTYYFRIYGVNAVGNGPSVSVMTRTKYDLHEINQAVDEEVDDDDEEVVEPWIIALVIGTVTISILGLGVSLLLLRNCGRSLNDVSVETTEEEAMELVPHITLNPSFNIDMLEYIEPEEPEASKSSHFTQRVKSTNFAVS